MAELLRKQLELAKGNLMSMKIMDQHSDQRLMSAALCNIFAAIAEADKLAGVPEEQWEPFDETVDGIRVSSTRQESTEVCHSIRISIPQMTNGRVDGFGLDSKGCPGGIITPKNAIALRDTLTRAIAHHSDEDVDPALTALRRLYCSCLPDPGLTKEQCDAMEQAAEVIASADCKLEGSE